MNNAKELAQSDQPHSEPLLWSFSDWSVISYNDIPSNDLK